MNNLYDILTGIISLQEATINKMKNINISGNNGYTPVRGVDYWTTEDIQEIQDYINSNLPPSGYTPIKGTDYWTTEDIQEIQDYISSNLPPSGYTPVKGTDYWTDTDI